VDYILILGKKITDVSIDHSEYSLLYNDLGADKNIDPTWIAKAKDGRYEMKLSVDKVIKTIFIYPIHDKLDGFDFNARTGRTFIIERMGIPSKSGQEMELPILGRRGGFDRYDYSNYSIHFEYVVGRQDIKMITLMLAEVAHDL
jgi:hypothetical protein